MMTRAAFLGLIFSMGAKSAQDTSQNEAIIFRSKVVAFHNHWDVYLRMFLGCPRRASDPAQCDPSQSTNDVSEFLACRKAAKTLFDFKS